MDDINGSHVVVIADVVSSTRLEPGDRADLQRLLVTVLADVSRQHHDALLTDLVVTAGDEFQCVAASPKGIPSLLWDVRERLAPAEVRVGVGAGAIFTSLDADSRLMDGPAFHLARAVLAERQQRTAFRGFGTEADKILNGLAGLLDEQARRFTPREQEVVKLLLRGLSQTQTAGELGVTRQAVSQYAANAGWSAFRDGERALEVALELFAHGERP
jgi:DNA-binding CsgD family transcriptional regulator